MAKKPLFNNEKATELLQAYIKSDRDPIALGEFLLECKNLISVIASGLATDEDHKEDLMQEARWHIIKVVSEFDPSREKKLYSWISVVARNSMIDYIRKERPSVELDEAYEDDSEISEADFLMDVVENLTPWFEARFPTILKGKDAPRILECILADLMNERVGKRKLTARLRLEHKLAHNDAKIIYETVLVRLRIMAGANNQKMAKPSEKSLEPELLEVLEDDQYGNVKDIFKGLSMKFGNISNRKV